MSVRKGDAVRNPTLVTIGVTGKVAEGPCTHDAHTCMLARKCIVRMADAASTCTCEI
jgi:hypothetical protein